MSTINYIIRRFFSIFINLIRLNSNIKKNVTLGKHVKLYSKYSISNSSIGDYTYIASNSDISRTNIGKFCSIGKNFTCGLGIHPLNYFSTSPVFYSKQCQCGITFSKESKFEEKGVVFIGNDVFIGTNVTILYNIKIGDGAVIAAGSVVVSDVPPYAVVGGVPARVLKYRFDEETISNLIKVRWWDKSQEELRDMAQFIDNPRKLISYLNETIKL